MKISDKAYIRRVIIVHGWADDPRQGWISWLVQQLRGQGIEALAPAMPEPRTPNIDIWLKELDRIVGELDEHTVLVGHSLGVYVLLRYLSGYTKQAKIAKLILVSGFAGHERVAKGKRALPEVDFDLIKQRAELIYSIFSDDDELVPPEWSEQLGKDLGATNILEKGKGHFAGLHGCEQLPVVLEAVTS